MSHFKLWFLRRLAWPTMRKHDAIQKPLSRLHQKTTKLWSRVTCADNLVKFGREVSEIRERTDRETDMLIATLSYPTTLKESHCARLWWQTNIQTYTLTHMPILRSHTWRGITRNCNFSEMHNRWSVCVYVLRAWRRRWSRDVKCA